MPAKPKSPERPYFLRSRDLGELQRVLLNACEPDESGFVSIPLLATQIGVTRSAIYRWLKKRRVPSKQVPVVLRGGRVAFADLAPYVDH